jgi:hypothetical protein
LTKSSILFIGLKNPGDLLQLKSAPTECRGRAPDEMPK